LKNYFNYPVNILFPEHCIICGNELCFTDIKDYPICGTCLGKLKIISGSRCTRCGLPLIEDVKECIRCKTTGFTFSCNYSIYSYHDWAVKEVLYMYKFRKKKILSGFFAEKIAGILNLKYAGIVVVPVPSDRKSLKKRGFDHIGEIADLLERKHGIKIKHLLKKRIKTREQKSLEYKERIENLKGSISMNTDPAHMLSGQELELVVLFDDIFTTGATMEECSRVLKRNGVKDIVSVTVAVD